MAAATHLRPQSPVISGAVLRSELALGVPITLLNASWAPGRTFADLPNIQHFSIDEIADRSLDGLPNMLPSVSAFEAAVAKLGLRDGSDVVIGDSTPFYMASARAWWMFRVFQGNIRIRVLESGALNESLAAVYVPPKVDIAAPRFVVRSFRRDLLVTLAEVVNNLDHPRFTILDARPPSRFSGADPEPRHGMRAGHIPGSINVDFKLLLDPQGRFLEADVARQILRKKGVSLGDDASGHHPLVTSCGSGVTACTLALGLHLLGIENVAVYDGSWSEYGNEASDQRIERL